MQVVTKEHNFSPVLYIIAGPNGAGKSTVASELIPNGTPYLNADSIREGLVTTAGNADLLAGRLFLNKLRETIQNRDSVAFETTLSGKCYLDILGMAKLSGYEIILCYLWLPSVDLALLRVKQRVASGGHDIPEETIRRRYRRSLENLKDLYFPCVDSWVVYNNSDVTKKALVARFGGSSGTNIIDHEQWQQFCRSAVGK